MNAHLNRPRLIPVIDVLGGQVVRGIAGNRKEYKPIVSQLTNSTDPLTVACALRDRWGTKELYVADITAILGGWPESALYHDLVDAGFRCWVDAGMKSLAFVSVLESLAEPDAGFAILALESSPSDALELVPIFGPSRIAFSIDLRDGVPLRYSHSWGADANGIADTAIYAGIRNLIVLDLSRVGMSGGVGTEKLCASIRLRHPKVDLIAGGGVRGPDDILRLRDAGVSGVLVASALHDLRLTPDNWPS